MRSLFLLLVILIVATNLLWWKYIIGSVFVLGLVAIFVMMATYIRHKDKQHSPGSAVDNFIEESFFFVANN